LKVEFGRPDRRLQVSDADHPPPPAAPEPPPPSPAAAPPRNGCVTAILVLMGVVLLLPGLCTLVVFGNHLAATPIGGLTFFVAFGGFVLILLAVMR
jgi:hypothetical protein